MAAKKYYRLTWRGFSGRLHKFKPKAFLREGRWCYVKDDGGIHGICPAIAENIVKANPCRKTARKGKRV